MQPEQALNVLANAAANVNSTKAFHEQTTHACHILAEFLKVGRKLQEEKKHAQAEKLKASPIPPPVHPDPMPAPTPDFKTTDDLVFDQGQVPKV